MHFTIHIFLAHDDDDDDDDYINNEDDDDDDNDNDDNDASANSHFSQPLSEILYALRHIQSILKLKHTKCCKMFCSCESCAFGQLLDIHLLTFYSLLLFLHILSPCALI